MLPYQVHYLIRTDLTVSDGHYARQFGLSYDQTGTSCKYPSLMAFLSCGKDNAAIEFQLDKKL